MKLPEPVSRTFSGLISDIEKGQIKIPQFQREFVWDIKKSAKLLDSIIKGYPIGTFIFWKTKERLRSVRDLGNCKLPESNEGDFVDYVLDGQQRLTSLFASLKGLKIEREIGKIEDYNEMFINLDASDDEDIVISGIRLLEIGDVIEAYYDEDDEWYKGVVAKFNKHGEPMIQYEVDDIGELADLLDATEYKIIAKAGKSKDKNEFNEKALIRISDLLYGQLTLLFSYQEKYHSKLQDYKSRIEAYNYSIILIREAPLDIATEIFTRINEGGKALTVFEIMVAKTFDSSKDFDLAEKYRKLIDTLREVDYETISDATILQTVSVILEKECTRKTILKLNKNKFIDTWDDTISAIHSTVDYFRQYYRIPVSQLLPYNALIVPFAYFFYHHKDKPTGDIQKYLQDFFWRVSFGTRYSSAVESKLAQDIKRIDIILKGELPRYDWAINTSSDFIKDNGWFSASRSYIKAILSIYAFHQPKSFNDNSIVNISNYWLKIATSKNYHHFFPKAYLLKKLDWDNKMFYINHVLNITIVDDFLNKREIAAKSPSTYMRKFHKQNAEIDSTMKTHLINDLETFGIWDDDYEKFFNQRAKILSKEMKKRIIESEIDRTMQAEISDENNEDDIITESNL